VSKNDYPALNAHHGIPGQVIFREGAGGMAVVDVINAQATATIVLQGAQLIAWTPRGHTPVIWLSRAARFAPGKSIRGGVPVCWPWFGPHASDPNRPAHGFARTVPWEVIGTRALDDGATRLDFRLVQNEATRALWPHATLLECRLRVGTALEIDLVTRNADRSAITIGDALHTYFEVGDVRRIAILGLEGCPYLDKMDGGKRKHQSGPVTIGAETDRIYLDSTADCLIDDLTLNRRIRIRKRGSRSTVVWNPWIEKSDRMGDFGADGYLNMVCVESANAADDVMTIAPGGEHHLWVRYDIAPLA
jgi:glucose-6-phosphate 1-epimerase